MSLWRVESYIADTLFYTVKYVPEWMPGANFQKVAKDHVQTITRFAESPFAFTKAQMDRGKDRQCFVSTLLRQGEDEEIVKWSAAAMYGGAGDTVCSNDTHMYSSTHPYQTDYCNSRGLLSGNDAVPGRSTQSSSRDG